MKRIHGVPVRSSWFGDSLAIGGSALFVFVWVVAALATIAVPIVAIWAIIRLVLRYG